MRLLGEPTTLRDCPVGLFQSGSGDLCVKVRQVPCVHEEKEPPRGYGGAQQQRHWHGSKVDKEVCQDCTEENHDRLHATEGVALVVCGALCIVPVE